MAKLYGARGTDSPREDRVKVRVAANRIRQTMDMPAKTKRPTSDKAKEN